MAVLVVDDITEIHDVVELVTYLTSTLANGDVEPLLDQGTLTLTKRDNPTATQVADLVRMDEENVCEDTSHRVRCSCQKDAANTDPRQLTVVEAPRTSGPVPYEACLRRGIHESVTDCWMCWSDVMRGAVPQAAVLAHSL